MLFRIFTVVAVLALAVSTWILSSPGRRPAAAAADAMPDLPGYYLKDAVLVDYGLDGLPRLHLDAARIDQIDHGTEVALSHVRVNYQTPAGQHWLLVGDVAHVETGGKVIDVKGNVRLTGDSTARAGTALVTTDTLTYDVAQAIATTKSDAQITFGVQTLNTHGLTANLKERTMRLESKVNGRFQR